MLQLVILIYFKEMVIMCVGTPGTKMQAAAELPQAMPQVETTTANQGQAILDQYSQNLRRRGINSTVRSSGSAATGTTNQGLASSGTSQTLG